MVEWEELERKKRYLDGLPVSGKHKAYILFYLLPNHLACCTEVACTKQSKRTLDQ